MIVGKREVHHGSDHDLAVDDNWLVLDGVKSENSGLWQVDDRSAHQGTENTSVADSESSSGHILDSQLAVTSLDSLSEKRKIKIRDFTYLLA